MPIQPTALSKAVTYALSRTAVLINLSGPHLAGSKRCALAAKDICSDLSQICGKASLEQFETHTGAFMGFYKINTLVYLCGLVSIYLRLAWLTDEGEGLTYWGLNEVIRRRAKAAKVKKPGLHDFRRAFALNFLRNGGDIFTLQSLMGHADLQVLRRYLAQTNDDLREAHRKASPVDVWKL
jgi:hypothetical protein